MYMVVIHQCMWTYIYVHGGDPSMYVDLYIYVYMVVIHQCMWTYIYVHGGDPSMNVDLYICTWW